MKHYRNMTALAFGVLAGTAIFAGGKTVAADTLDTEIAGAGIAVALNDYTAGVATEAETQATDISTLIPQQSAEEAQQQAAQAQQMAQPQPNPAVSQAQAGGSAPAADQWKCSCGAMVSA